MSYIAKYYGDIELNEGLEVDKFRKVVNILREEFDGDIDLLGGDVITLCGEGNYHECDAINTLEEIIPFITSCCIEFLGETNEFWKLELVDGEIKDIPGEIVYFQERLPRTYRCMLKDKDVLSPGVILQDGSILDLRSGYVYDKHNVYNETETNELAVKLYGKNRETAAEVYLVDIIPDWPELRPDEKEFGRE